ncbi:MAG: DinB family protein [Aeromicrobium sp.]|uniref:DinB family protein n=1 Tax=Aeromicrobium sp. TaxID=1871063 RepID=UPI0039E6EF14
MTTTDTAIEPDDKDWTWVLREPCQECGFDAAATDPASVGSGLAGQAAAWRRVLERPDARERRRPDRWSDLEYACHVRDVLTIFTGRFEQVLTEDPARFANWDQDVAAIEGDYAHADPASVAGEIDVEAARLAAVLARVDGADWERRALRSNGSEFTAATLAQYLQHDLAHHLVDVGA